MANSDKNIIITPNIGAAADPKIVFSGADASTAAQNITLTAYPTNGGTLSFDGSTGQLFSVTNSMSGTIFSASDVSGIPSIEVIDTGLVKVAQYSGNVLLGTGTDTGLAKLQVTGSLSLTGNILHSPTGRSIYGPNPSWSSYLYVGGDGVNGISRTGSIASVVTTNGNLHLDSGSDKAMYLNYYSGTGGIQFGNGASGVTATLTGAGVFNGTNVTVNGNQTLHAGNYTSYSPTLTGGSASGTWGISVTGSSASCTGNAATASSAPANGGTATALSNSNYINRTGSFGSTVANFQNVPVGTYRYQGDDPNLADSPGGTWWHYEHMRHSNGSNYWGTTIAWGWEDNANRLAVRNVTGGSFQGWVYYLNSSNYTSYAMPAGSSATNSVDVRAPIFYDSNDTAYYTDPASTSVMNRISTVRTDNWLYIDNSYGHSVVGKYDSYILQGVWAMGDSYKLTAAGAAGNLYGIAWSHPNAGGVAANLSSHGMLILENGTFKGAWGGGSFRTPGDIRALIYYDYDNTAYYLDSNGTSNVSMHCIGAWYFRSNRNTTSDSPPLQAYSSDAGGAIMSFHRGGQYAVNFGLDSDNVMRIGGWSAAFNRWQLDMSGNMYAAGNITAYSSDVRLKENIVTIDNALSKLHKIRGVYYDWKDIVDDLGFNPIDRHDIGVIAQEVREVIPQAIKPAPFDTGCDGKSESGENYITVQMEKIIPLLIEAIKEQQTQFEKQQTEMDELKALVKELLNK